MAGAGFIPKAALTASRAVYYPFTIPTKLNESALNVGNAAHSALGGVNAAVGQAYISLQPKGPAKWLVPLFVKTDAAVKHSMEIAARNENVFWKPFADGTEGIGRAIAGPGAYYYAKQAGFPEPSNPDLIKGLLNLGLFKYPVPAGGNGGGQPAAPPPPDAGAQGAADGAGQAAPPAAA